MLAFLYSTAAGDTCILIAQQIRGALDELAPSVPVLIVSADPAADTAAQRAGASSQQVSLTGRVHYLTGSPAAAARGLARVPRRSPASAGRAAFDTLRLGAADRPPRDASGCVFGLEQLTPEALAHDIGKLAGRLIP